MPFVLLGFDISLGNLWHFDMRSEETFGMADACYCLEQACWCKKLPHCLNVCLSSGKSNLLIWRGCISRYFYFKVVDPSTGGASWLETPAWLCCAVACSDFGRAPLQAARSTVPSDPGNRAFGGSGHCLGNL